MYINNHSYSLNIKYIGWSDKMNVFMRNYLRI